MFADSRTVGTVFVAPNEVAKVLKQLVTQAEGIVDHRVDQMGLRHMEDSEAITRKLVITVSLEEE